MVELSFFKGLEMMWVRVLEPYSGRMAGALSNLLWWKPLASFALLGIRMPCQSLLVTYGECWFLECGFTKKVE